MKIERNKEMERKALDKIKEHLSRAPRSLDKWHVSDLLYPLKSYFGRIDPKPMSDLQALYFLAGRAHHGILEACLGKWDKAAHEKARADAGEFEKHGIYYSPDLRQPYPWEIKTSRSQYEPKGDYAKKFEGYLNQLNQYQALMEDDRGVLLVFYLCLKGTGYGLKPALRMYTVRLTKAERAAKLKWMVGMRNALDKAVQTKKHDALPLCPKFMCGDCPWFKRCKPWLKDPKRKDAQDK